MKLNSKLNLGITLLVSATFLLTSCNPELAKSKVLEEEVMSIHDEVMPKMTDLQSAKKELEMALANGADSTSVFELLNQVDEADESMMVWMEEYEGPGEAASEEDKLNYLNLELSRIKKVKENMLNALQAVNKFTTQYIKPINDTIK
jgi:ABC-type oligopeptide transport system substrate-binding subunit